jgi:CubicO group peptidase (beta-lactamase class C family)
LDPYRRKLIAFVSCSLLTAALALAAGIASADGAPRFRADGWHADEFGRKEGYPFGKSSPREDQRFLVGSYSRGDVLLEHRVMKATGEVTPLRRAAKEPSIHYRFGRSYSSIDDYLDNYPVTGLLIARDGEILVERYQYDRRDTDHFTSQSMAKTVLALLVGIAVKEGQIRSIADAAETYAPELRGSELGQTPVKALLTMSSGIAFQHGFDERRAVGDLAILNYGPGGAAGLREINHRVAAPGIRFNYSAADNRALGLVLAGATKRNIADYAGEKLWGPLGAESSATWQLDRAKGEITSCCIAAVLRDWARLGLMLANDGTWHGRQIVPREWILEATTANANYLKAGVATPTYGYGYQVWLLPGKERQFALRGLRGQAIFVDPGTKTVMVQTAVLPTHSDAVLLALWSGVMSSLP